MTQQAQELAVAVAKALSDKKGLDIQIIDISKVSILADCFVVASGTNPIQVRSLSDDVRDALTKCGAHVVRTDGYEAGRWVVLDASDVIIHVFHQDERAFYNLERLWSNGTNTTVYNG